MVSIFTSKFVYAIEILKNANMSARFSFHVLCKSMFWCVYVSDMLLIYRFLLAVVFLWSLVCDFAFFCKFVSNLGPSPIFSFLLGGRGELNFDPFAQLCLFPLQGVCTQEKSSAFCQLVAKVPKML